jgi:hypothetical protein
MMIIGEPLMHVEYLDAAYKILYFTAGTTRHTCLGEYSVTIWKGPKISVVTSSKFSGLTISCRAASYQPLPSLLMYDKPEPRVCTHSSEAISFCKKVLLLVPRPSWA